MTRARIFVILVRLTSWLLSASMAGAFDTVVIDPGHGGNDEGTAWYHIREKDTTLAVAKRLEKILRKDGIKTVLTRSKDTYVSLDERAAIANRHRNSLLLSIHFNGSSMASSDGFATYYFSKSVSGKFVARTIQDALDESLSTRNRGIISETYALLVRTVGSAVLVECGFLSNKAEAARFASADGQQWLAEALALGIIRANPVVINDPPEAALAKREACEKNLLEKLRKRKVLGAPNKQKGPSKSRSKRK
jgi:N-acetylmuramoyl-L-alanine amidase